MIEPLILSHLIRDDEYTRAVLPFLKKEYFTTSQAQTLYVSIHEFISTYKVTPTVDAIKLALERVSLSGNAYTDTDLAARRTSTYHTDHADRHRRSCAGGLGSASVAD